MCEGRLCWADGVSGSGGGGSGDGQSRAGPRALVARRRRRLAAIPSPRGGREARISIAPASLCRPGCRLLVLAVQCAEATPICAAQARWALSLLGRAEVDRESKQEQLFPHLQHLCHSWDALDRTETAAKPAPCVLPRSHAASLASLTPPPMRVSALQTSPCAAPSAASCSGRPAPLPAASHWWRPCRRQHASLQHLRAAAAGGGGGRHPEEGEPAGGDSGLQDSLVQQLQLEIGKKRVRGGVTGGLGCGWVDVVQHGWMRSSMQFGSQHHHQHYTTHAKHNSPSPSPRCSCQVDEFVEAEREGRSAACCFRHPATQPPTHLFSLLNRWTSLWRVRARG